MFSPVVLLRKIFPSSFYFILYSLAAPDDAAGTTESAVVELDGENFMKEV